MIRLGITGTIGSGKSTISRAFSALGVPVYSSDARARLLQERDMQLVSEIKRLFGEDIYTVEGRLRRAELASIVFSDGGRLAELNGVVHPRVISDFVVWSEACARAGARLVVCESAIMVESGMVCEMDRLLVVALPLETRIRRTMVRDGVSREQVLARLSNQRSQEELLTIADYVLQPDDKHFVLPEIASIINTIQ